MRRGWGGLGLRLEFWKVVVGIRVGPAGFRVRDTWGLVRVGVGANSGGSEGWGELIGCFSWG